MYYFIILVSLLFMSGCVSSPSNENTQVNPTPPSNEEQIGMIGTWCISKMIKHDGSIQTFNQKMPHHFTKEKFYNPKDRNTKMHSFHKVCNDDFTKCISINDNEYRVLDCEYNLINKGTFQRDCNITSKSTGKTTNAKQEFFRCDI